MLAEWIWSAMLGSKASSAPASAASAAAAADPASVLLPASKAVQVLPHLGKQERGGGLRGFLHVV